MSAEAPSAAHEYVKRRADELRTVPIEIALGVSVRFLNTDDAEQFAGHAEAQAIRAGIVDLQTAQGAARAGDPLFIHALGLLGIAMPHRLKRLQTGRKRETNFFRDIAIVMLVQELCERFPPMKATGSANGGENSACGLVAAELKMSYPAICAVWKRLGKQI